MATSSWFKTAQNRSLLSPLQRWCICRVKWSETESKWSHCSPAESALCKNPRTGMEQSRTVCMHTHTLNKKKVSQRERENKNLQGREKGGERGGVLIKKEGSQTGSSNWKCSTLSVLRSLSLSLSHWVYVSHSIAGIFVGWDQLRLCTPAASVCQPVHLPLVGIDTERRGKRGSGGRGSHKTKVAPIEAKAPHTLQIFTLYTHTYTQLLFSTSLSRSSHCT